MRDKQYTIEIRHKLSASIQRIIGNGYQSWHRFKRYKTEDARNQAFDTLTEKAQRDRYNSAEYRKGEE